MKRKQFGILISLIAIFVLSLFVWGPFQPKRPFLRIPVEFLHNSVCIQTCIEKRPYLLELDTGFVGCFSLHQNVLDAIVDKTETKSRVWKDVQNNQYTSPSFIIKDIEIDAFKIWNATASREEEYFINKGSRLGKSSNGPVQLSNNGRMGARILRILDYWLIDLPRSEIVAIRDIDKIKKDSRFSFNGFVEIDLELSNEHIILSAQTDFGCKKFALDTGAERSVLKLPSAEFFNHQRVRSEQLIISGYDFGYIDLHLYAMPDDFKFDGLLGLDFLKKHAVYLDFKKNQAWIGPEDLSVDRPVSIR